jgi:exodeoxyribonuclease V alpha subunit
VVGHAATVTAGRFLTEERCLGEAPHPRSVPRVVLGATPMTTLEGIERHLASGLIGGIGPVYETRLVRASGDRIRSHRH